MSTESEFRALLAAHARLVTLVGTRIALNAVPENSAYPLVVFVVTERSEHGLDNSLHGTEVTVDVQCYAENAIDAGDVAYEVIDAIGASPHYVVTGRASAFETELDLDAVVVTATRWIT